MNEIRSMESGRHRYMAFDEAPDLYDASNQDDLKLSPAFWRNFVSNNWEKRTFAQSRQLTAVPITSDELFDTMVTMSKEHEEQGVYDIRMYVEGEEVESDYYRLLPKASDKGFSEYRSRVIEAIDGKEFALVADCIEMPTSLRVWTYSFLKGMYGPLKGISTGHFWSIFFGSYTTTPYGVHDHTESVFAESAFYFPLRGKKEMRTWESSYVERNPEIKGSKDYQVYEHASDLLSAQQGGMMYWPSDRWHVGSSKGGDVSIVLAVKTFADVFAFMCFSIISGSYDSYFHSKIKRRFAKVMAQLYMMYQLCSIKMSKRARRRQIRNLPFDPENLQSSAENVPERLSRLKPLFFFLGRNTERVFARFWLLHLTLLGMEPSYSTKKVPSTKTPQNLVITRNEGIPILWTQLNQDLIMVAANESTCELPVSLIAVVKRLANSSDGQKFTYQGLMNMEQLEGADQSELDSIVKHRCALVNFLGASGAFRDLSSN